MENYFLSKEGVQFFFLRLYTQGVVFYPAIENYPPLARDTTYWRKFDPAAKAEVTLDRIRTAESCRPFFLPFKERVASLGEVLKKEIPNQILVGVKACDLYPLQTEDKIYREGDFVDPFYVERRNKTVLISTDCPYPEDCCFCTTMGLAPYIESGSDLNIGFAEKGYLLEPLSDAGVKIIETCKDLFSQATSRDLSYRDAYRKRATAQLAATNPEPLKADLALRIKGNLDNDFWLAHGKDCVECYACEQICPTCFCFLLFDQAKDTTIERVRVWDHCYIQAYGRVGGGVNPRADFAKRFRNRIECKFSAFDENFKLYACSGCGRCIRGCTGRIDIRKILHAV
jgi:NAD-dependent dihydropyrimidine dehydrogenase PreA subunit